MASVLINGMAMPKSCLLCPFGDEFGKCCVNAELEDANELTHSCPLIPIPDHGNLIDGDAFRKTMYHDTFETDSDLQKWESGCWIRYKMFERNIKSAPVVIPAERSEE